MLKHVIIYENMKTKDCADKINATISDYPDDDVCYEMLIENSVRVGDTSDTRYTLLINVESREDE